MVEQSPVKTYIVEYREPAVDGIPGRLVGACLTDQQADGLSMIYSFFEPDEPAPAQGPHQSTTLIAPKAGVRRSGLGTYIILDHIVRAGRASLPYVYLGYWVEEAKRMAYKAKFRPLEKLGPGGWHLFDPEQRELPLT
jgi:arginine-tRNA-protein transferase